MASEIELAWAAGIIDGEGCISIELRYSLSTTKGQVRLCVVNTNERGIRHFASLLKYGSVYLKRSKNAKWQDIWSYQIHNAQAIDVIKRLSPYLVFKKKQAALAIECFEECISQTTQGVKLTIKQEALLLIFYEEMAALNKRGPK